MSIKYLDNKSADAGEGRSRKRNDGNYWDNDAPGEVERVKG